MMNSIISNVLRENIRSHTLTLELTRSMADARGLLLPEPRLGPKENKANQSYSVFDMKPIVGLTWQFHGTANTLGFDASLTERNLELLDKGLEAMRNNPEGDVFKLYQPNIDYGDKGRRMIRVNSGSFTRIQKYHEFYIRRVYKKDDPLAWPTFMAYRLLIDFIVPLMPLLAGVGSGSSSGSDSKVEVTS